MWHTLAKLVLFTLAVTTLLTGGAVAGGRFFMPDGNVLAIRVHAPIDGREKFYTLIDTDSGIKYELDNMFPCAWEFAVSEDGRVAGYAPCESGYGHFLVKNGITEPFFPVNSESQPVPVDDGLEWSKDGKL